MPTSCCVPEYHHEGVESSLAFVQLASGRPSGLPYYIQSIHVVCYVAPVHVPLTILTSSTIPMLIWGWERNFDKAKSLLEAKVGHVNYYRGVIRVNYIYLLVLFPQKRNGIVFSSGVNYVHSGGNIQSE